jgi:hypothetical protein
MFGRKGLDAEGVAPARQNRDVLPVPVRFDITPRPGKMLLGIAFFSAGAALMVAKLLDPRGVNINGVIELGPLGADIFFVILLLATLWLVGLGCIGLARSFGSKVFVTLDNQAITGPNSYLQLGTKRIAFGAVRSVNLIDMNSHQFVEILAADGGKIKVGSGNFRVSAEWPRFLAEINARMAHVR